LTKLCGVSKRRDAEQKSHYQNPQAKPGNNTHVQTAPYRLSKTYRMAMNIGLKAAPSH